MFSIVTLSRISFEPDFTSKRIPKVVTSISSSLQVILQFLIVRIALFVIVNAVPCVSIIIVSSRISVSDVIDCDADTSRA